MPHNVDLDECLAISHCLTELLDYLMGKSGSLR